jgi:hypothetical protein
MIINSKTSTRNKPRQEDSGVFKDNIGTFGEVCSFGQFIGLWDEHIIEPNLAVFDNSHG